MIELADILRECAEEYFSTRPFSKSLQSHIRACTDILACRTIELGGHRVICDHCGYTQDAYHSCNNRSCPKCNQGRMEDWLAQRRAELLPVPYFHAVLTVPHQLNKLVYLNQKALYSVLMRAAAESILELIAEQKFVGGKGGIVGVLHTWNRTLQFHPHVHFLIPGAAIDGTQFRLSRSSFLIPTRKLAVVFRDRFLAMARKALPDIVFSRKLYKMKWVTYIADVVNDPENVLQYLGRYIKRVAITNSRIEAFEDGKVTFRYKDSKTNTWHRLSLPAIEFIERYLKHVLPGGFHKVRYYGFLSPRGRPKLKQFCKQQPVTQACESDEKDTSEETKEKDPTYLRPCRRCSKGRMLRGMFFSRRKKVRAPP